MGKSISRYMKRPFQNYNVESRAHKIISQNKPTPAPHHKVEQMEIEQILKAILYKPTQYQETLQKHEELDRNLKKVFVTSQSKKENDGNLKRPLPTNRSSYIEPTLGIVEPLHIPKGKVSLLNALKFITDYHADSKRCSVDHIVKEYSLPETTVRNILGYCRTFEIYISSDPKSKAKFVGPTVQRIKVNSRPALKEISSGAAKKDEKA